jgi:Tfp pilus assembly protein PilX
MTKRIGTCLMSLVVVGALAGCQSHYEDAARAEAAAQNAERAATRAEAAVTRAESAARRAEAVAEKVGSAPASRHHHHR